MFGNKASKTKKLAAKKKSDLLVKYLEWKMWAQIMRAQKP